MLAISNVADQNMAMPESQTDGSERRTYPLYFEEGWREILESPDTLEYQQWMRGLVSLTQDGLQSLPDAPEWANDEAEVLMCWQRAVEAVAVASIPEDDLEEMIAVETVKIGLITLKDSIGGINWDEEGLVFTLPDVNNPGIPEQIDIRGMATPRPIMTMGFETFKALSDEEVKELNQRVLDALSGPFTGNAYKYPAFRAALHDVTVCTNYAKWRIWGKPDRELDGDEVMERVNSLIEARQADDPEYGSLPAEAWEQLTEAEQDTLRWILYYLAQTEAAFGYPTIESPSIAQYFGDEAVEHAKQLTEKGALIPLNTYNDILGSGTIYGLGDEFYHYWLVNLAYREV